MVVASLPGRGLRGYRGCIVRFIPSAILSVPSDSQGLLVPSPLKLKKIEDDLEFEWLLCLAGTLQRYR